MRRPFSILTVALFAAACSAGPDYRPPAVYTNAAPPPALVESNAAVFDANPPPDGWWRLFGNPALDGLIDQALRRNPDVRSALATLEQAEAQLRLYRRQRTPSTDLTVNPVIAQASADEKGLAKEPPPGFVFTANEMLSYDFDVAGRLRRQVEAAEAQVGGRAAALDMARITVAASTAGAYASVCATGLQIKVQRDAIATAAANLSVVRRYLQAGIIGANDVVRSRTQLDQVQAQLPDLLAQNRAALYMLATLIGRPPEQVPTGVADCAAPPVLRTRIPVGDGTQLLRRRPDVREAERQLAASVAQIGVVSAELYPNVTLGAQIGEVAQGVADIPKYRAFKWSIGPLISWSFPNTSVTRARIAASDAAARAQLARFDGTVLTALRETETSLVTLARRLDTERQLTQARDDAALALRNVQRLYRGGVSPIVDVLDTQRTLIQAQTQLAQTTAQVSQDQITLFQSLGGGWQNAPRPQETPLDRVTK